MMSSCRLRISRGDFNLVHNHLYPGDGDEHGAVLLAGMSTASNQIVLHVREVHSAREGVDYVAGSVGYRALAPTFIHRMITRARDERLVYLAAHNHDCDQNVRFSAIDLASHERGYPALLQIARGMPVGGAVFGRRSVEIDLWLPSGQRIGLDRAAVVGNTINHLTPSRRGQSFSPSENHDRQIRMFGRAGQAELSQCHVGIVGLGGIGSLVAEYLSRLGVGDFCLVDDDRIERSNLSRIVGASPADADSAIAKVVVAQRLIHQANANARVQPIVDDVAKLSVCKALTACDYLFLAADSMRARLAVNAIVHQYLIPAVQLGSKVRSDVNGAFADIMCANRPMRPGNGCLLCNQLIDATQLAVEAKTESERKAQAYGVEEPNPSVISLNAVAAAHAVNDFLLDYLDLRPDGGALFYEHFHFLKRSRVLVEPRRDHDCSECSRGGRRYGRGDSIDLPCIDG